MNAVSLIPSKETVTWRPGYKLVYVIADTPATAEKIAVAILAGNLPSTYPNREACVASWERYPLPLKARYKPFIVTATGNDLAGFSVNSTKRVDP